MRSDFPEDIYSQDDLNANAVATVNPSATLPTKAANCGATLHGVLGSSGVHSQYLRRILAVPVRSMHLPSRPPVAQVLTIR